jgi:hypothetical protein
MSIYCERAEHWNIWLLTQDPGTLCEAAGMVIRQHYLFTFTYDYQKTKRKRRT